MNKPKVEVPIKLYKDAGVLSDAYERDRQIKFQPDPLKPKNEVSRTMIFNYDKHGDVAGEGFGGIDCDRSNNEIVNGFMGK